MKCGDVMLPVPTSLISLAGGSRSSGLISDRSGRSLRLVPCRREQVTRPVDCVASILKLGIPQQAPGSGIVARSEVEMHRAYVGIARSCCSPTLFKGASTEIAEVV